MLPNYGTETANSNTVDVAYTVGDLEYPRASDSKSRISLSVLVLLFLGLGVTTILIKDFVPLKNEKMIAESQISLDIQEPTGNKPNFIVIVADDMAFNSIGYQPYELSIATPFLTKLSAQGIRNLNYYGQEVCTPSRAALLTGTLESKAVIT